MHTGELWAADGHVFEPCEIWHRAEYCDLMRLHAAAAIRAVNTLTWKNGQDAGAGAKFVGVFRRVFGLEDLVKVEKFPVPPVDEILIPSFSLDLYHKPLRENQTHETDLYRSLFVILAKLKVCGKFWYLQSSQWSLSSPQYQQ